MKTNCMFKNIPPTNHFTKGPMETRSNTIIRGTKKTLWGWPFSHMALVKVSHQSPYWRHIYTIIMCGVDYCSQYIARIALEPAPWTLLPPLRNRVIAPCYLLPFSFGHSFAKVAMRLVLHMGMMSLVAPVSLGCSGLAFDVCSGSWNLEWRAGGVDRTGMNCGGGDIDAGAVATTTMGKHSRLYFLLILLIFGLWFGHLFVARVIAFALAMMLFRWCVVISAILHIIPICSCMIFPSLQGRRILVCIWVGLFESYSNPSFIDWWKVDTVNVCLCTWCQLLFCFQMCPPFAR